MDLWEKIKKGFEESSSAISEKASELATQASEALKSGAEVAKEGAEKVSTLTSDLTRLGKLKLEIRELHGKIEKEFTQLGGQVYDLFAKDNLSEAETKLADQLKKMKKMENDLSSKEKEVEELSKMFESKSIDRKSISELKKDLELGGGTIEQVEVAESSSAAGKKLKELRLPKEILVGTILRGDDVIIPDGETELKAGDKVTLLGKIGDVARTMKRFGS